VRVRDRRIGLRPTSLYCSWGVLVFVSVLQEARFRHGAHQANLGLHGSKRLGSNRKGQDGGLGGGTGVPPHFSVVLWGTCNKWFE